MTDELETIFHVDREDGSRLTLAVDRDNRLYANGKQLMTQSRLTLAWWVNAAAVITGASTMALAIVEVGRSVGLWQ